MCGRYVMSTPADVLVERFEVDEVRSDEFPPSWNVAPTDPVPVIVEREGKRLLGTQRWGLVPHWADSPKDAARKINARAETVHDAPAFRDAFRRHRCLVPANGFYEWRRMADGKKQPYFIAPADGQPIAFAGLWAAWRDKRDPDGEFLRTCTIVTTNANAAVRELHDRMPVVLPSEDWATWLDADADVVALKALLVPALDDALTVTAANPAVNSVRNNGPELLQP
jgi:putative SOS response-associated peptidase YedK